MVSRYLAVLNSSINFIIYCVAGKQFRSVLVTVLHHKTETTIQHLAEARLNPVFCKLTHAFLFQEITVITKATACSPETLLGRRMSSIEENKIVDTSDLFEKGNVISDLLDISDIRSKEISLANEKDNGIEEGNPNMYDIKGLSDDMDTKEINTCLVDSREISDTAQVVGSEDMEKRKVVESSSLVSHNKSCLLESHL